MENGNDYSDIARSLIQPLSQSSPFHQPVGREEQDSALRVVKVPRATLVGPLIAQAPPSNSSDKDKAAQLRAQLLASRKNTPDPGRSTDSDRLSVSKDKVISNMAGPSYEMNKTDIDILIAEEAKSHPKGLGDEESVNTSNPAVINGRAKSDHDKLPDLTDAVLRHSHPIKSPVAHTVQRHELVQYKLPPNGGMQPTAEPSDGLTSLQNRRQSGTDHEKNRSVSEAETEREISRLKQVQAAFAYKDLHGISAVANHGSDRQNGDFDVKQHDRKASTNASSDIRDEDYQEKFDYSKLPLEVFQWLELSGFFNAEYRERELKRHNKRLELQRLMTELDQEGQADRSLMNRQWSHQPMLDGGPLKKSRLDTVPSSASEPMDDKTVKQASAPEARNTNDLHLPASPAVKRSPSPSPSSKSPRIQKRLKGDQANAASSVMEKPVKPEPRIVEQRSPREEVPDGSMMRKPSQRSSGRVYDSYKPADRRESHHVRALSPDRSVRSKGPYAGYPIVACRYFKEGRCYKGASCTFLHE